MDSCDVLVVGGGMAGVSIGYELAADRRVLVADMEHTLAYHTTGRSAAMLIESHGGPTIRALTVASRGYFENPPDEARLITPLPVLYIAPPGRGQAVTALYQDARPLVGDVLLLDAEEAVALQPLLRPGAVELAMMEPAAMEIDVHAMHQGFVHGLRARGGATATGARVVSAAPEGDGWTVALGDGRRVRAGVVVNAAGAWADDVARIFGASPAGLRPLRRTAFIVDAPDGARPPMISEVDDAFYVKPDAGRLLCSPADETPQDAGDASADETEIARAIQMINEVTTLDVRHVRSSWAGLRTFAADRNPVVGADPSVEGLFWFAGQGGYGLQTAPALARCGAALLRGEPLPADVAVRGVTAEKISPGRMSNPAA